MSKDVREQGGAEAQADVDGDQGKRVAAAAFVWLAWAFCFAAALAYVAHYGVNFPTWDEYSYVPYLTGARPVTLGWLWSPHMGHRTFLPRLVYIGIIRAAGGDFRAGMYLNAALLGAAALVLVVAARRIRGWTAYTDAIFPLALLHFGHASCLMWSVTVGRVLSTTLLCVLLSLIAGIRGEVSWRRAAAIFVTLLLLAFSGAVGVVVTPAPAAWLVIVGIGCLRREGERRRGIGMLLMGVCVFAVIGVYAAGLTGHAGDGGAGLRETLLGAGEFFGSTLGAVAMLSSIPAALATVGLMLVAVIVLASAWIVRREERAAIGGLLMFLAGLVLMGAAVGWGRAGLGSGYIIASRRFAAPAALIPCAVYVVVMRFCPEVPRRFLRMTLFALLLGVFAYNIRDGLDHGGVVRATKQAAVVDAWAGRSSEEIAQRNYIHSNKRTLAEGIEMIRGARYGPFALSEGERTSRLRAYYGRLCTMFATVPDEIRCAREVASGAVGGRSVLVVHAPGEIRFDVGSGAWTISGSFGVMPRGWMEALTDGVGFAVLAVDRAGAEEILFERFLDPVRREDDRGFQTLEVSLATDQPATLVLRTLPGPVDRHAWSFWTDIRISSQQPRQE